MHLIIQIPCYNEAETLPATLADIPREIPGCDRVEILIIDDGSTDDTIAVARACGVHHVVRHKRNRGLARTFRSGIDACLWLGADIIVNTDGDNQYCGADIPRLIAPILSGQADVVVGDRQTSTVEHFSRTKRLLQALGSMVARKLSATNIPDAVSGFRAFSRPAALQLNVLSSFSYTLETIMQAGKNRLAIASVPIRTNPKTRESRLFKSLPQFIGRSAATMVRMYSMYSPLRVFFYLSVVLTLIGALPIVRFLYFYALGAGSGHVQSLVLGSVFVLMGFMTMVLGLLADLISFNRQLIELTLEKVRRLELRELAGDNERGSRFNSPRESATAPISAVTAATAEPASTPQR